MFKKEFILISISKKLIRLKKIIFLSVFFEVLIGIIFYYNEENEILKFIFAYFLLVWAVMNFISGFFISSYKKNGKISFSNNKILTEKEISLSEIEKLKINANNYQGESNAGMILGIGSAYPQEGIDNNIELLLKNGEEYKFQILFRYKKDINIIYKIFRFYYKSGINVEFYQKNKKIL